MRSIRLTSLLVCAALLACSAVKTSSDYDPRANFASYQTYGWLPDPPPTGHPRADNPLLRERVRNSIDRALAAKGFRRSEDPDILVTYHLSAQQKLDVRTYYNDFYGPYGYVIGVPDTEVRQYEEGTLVVDVVDAHAKKVVWRGVGSRRLQQPSGQQDPAEIQKRVDETVDETLAKFPPQPKT